MIGSSAGRLSPQISTECRRSDLYPHRDYNPFRGQRGTRPRLESHVHRGGKDRGDGSIKCIYSSEWVIFDRLSHRELGTMGRGSFSFIYPAWCQKHDRVEAAAAAAEWRERRGWEGGERRGKARDKRIAKWGRNMFLMLQAAPRI